ncbi:cation:proton antiporter regulatory subunit [Halosimplex amylolyticum]|uniref:cation:proton antiporter regulatory subunit n=1 Tax=Halosimplex amylolyticum TaxID=3396616 RepID=UPI003F576388
MTVYETEVPGVGRKFELEIDDDRRLVVVIHHDGKREVYLRPSPEADSERLFTLSGDEARKLGSILDGAYFQPVELDDAQVPLGEAIMEWHTVGADADIVGATLEECAVRQRTGTSLIAIQRGGDTIPNPPADTVIEPGDTVVALGTREEHGDLAALLAAEE